MHEEIKFTSGYAQIEGTPVVEGELTTAVAGNIGAPGTPGPDGEDEYKLIHFADPRLNTRPPAYVFPGEEGEPSAMAAEELEKLLTAQMLKFGGIGLSANQIGLPYRVFVMGNGETLQAVFNPNIVGVSAETVLMQEGCLSFPGFFLSLRRPAEVAATYQTADGKEHVGTFRGIGARVFLHEYDHMEGINFTHHASQFKIQHEMAKYKKRLRKVLKKKGFKLTRKPTLKRP
jgi:peptide deformylase